MPVAVPIAVAAIGAASSMAAAHTAAGAADRAASRQQQSMDNQLAFQKMLYDKDSAIFDPIKRKLAGEVMSDQPLDYGLAKDQINYNFGNAARDEQNQLALRGAAGSGLDKATVQGNTLAKARALSQAWLSGQKSKRELAQGLLGFDRSDAQGQGVSGVLGNQAGVYGDQTRQWAGMAGAANQGVGNALNNGAYLWMMGQQGGAPNPNSNKPQVDGTGSSTDAVNNWFAPIG